MTTRSSLGAGIQLAVLSRCNFLIATRERRQREIARRCAVERTQAAGSAWHWTKLQRFHARSYASWVQSRASSKSPVSAYVVRRTR